MRVLSAPRVPPSSQSSMSPEKVTLRSEGFTIILMVYCLPAAREVSSRIWESSLSPVVTTVATRATVWGGRMRQ